MLAKKLAASVLALLMIAVGFSLVFTGARADTSSADSFGYRWIDSTGTEAYYNQIL